MGAHPAMVHGCNKWSSLFSALYVVDLKKFRKIAAGDRLRGQYQGLSQDPNSLSNLDQVSVLLGARAVLCPEMGCWLRCAPAAGTVLCCFGGGVGAGPCPPVS